MDPKLLFSQLRALILRNFLIKTRNSYQICVVLLLPIVTMIFIIMQSHQPELNVESKGIIEYNLPFTYTGWNALSKRKAIQLCVAPRTVKDKFLVSIQNFLSLHLRKFVKVLIFEKESYLDEELALKYTDNSTECDIGITFKDSGSYILRISGDGCLSKNECSIPSHGLISSSQQAVDTAYMQDWTDLPELTLPPTKVRGLIDAKEAAKLVFLNYLKLLMILILQPLVCVITENVIQEKNNKIKESMLLMGMKSVSYWSAWLFSKCCAHSHYAPSVNNSLLFEIEKVKKIFPSFARPATALNGVSMTLFKGEITCLLGPNGAGKSTLMKIISRVMPPDSGRVTTETAMKLGVCPQENILHDELNPYEHLMLFGRLKGIPSSELKSKVTHLLSSFDLSSSQDTKSKVLSGGQKRKLCVSIAMIGDPEVLLLDEPSSGMSPQSRKQLWNMLQDYTKAGRSVLFTTHYMDEAELLSDRIALLNYGKLHCYGRPMCIKRQFGGGYIIKITLRSEASMYCKSDLISILSNLSSRPKIICASDAEVIVKLPSFDVACCIEFFSQMEKHYVEMGPDCFTITVSALEEIFTQIAGDAEERPEYSERLPDDDTDKKSDATSLQNETDSINNQYSYFRSFAILLRYRAILLIRSVYSFFPLVIPIFSLLMHAFFQKMLEESTSQISPEFYRHEVIHVVNSSGQPLKNFERALSKLELNFILKEPGDILHDESYVKVDISRYELSSKKFDVKWSWDISLRRIYALPILQNLISNILWVTYIDYPDKLIQTTIHPIVKVDLNTKFVLSKKFLTLCVISFCIVLISVVIGLEAVKEKEKKIIWLISRTKDNCKTYWMSTFIGHFVLCTLSFIIMKLELKLLELDSDIYTPVWNAYFLAFPGCLLSTYLIGFVFKTYKSADIGMTIFILFATFGLFVGFLIGQLKRLSYINILNAVACFIFPLFTPFGLIVFLSDLPLICVVHAFLIMNLEKWKDFIKGVKVQRLEEPSWNEQYNQKSSVVLKSVRKVYGEPRCPFRKKKGKVAIKNLNLDCYEGEILAIMGSNGAGKSTLMKLLSENRALTSGEIIIRDKFNESISYCSEENIIWPELSVKEHLQLFAVLNGIPISTINEVINRIISDLDLTDHTRKQAKHLSGGLQRRLCIALTLLGNSKLVLLDEPTTGMDPISKQNLWKRLHCEFPPMIDRTLILSTHSSNEAEVNCSRIGLFISGILRCIGTSQELKKQFSKGFELTIRMKASRDDAFNSLLSNVIPGIIEKGQRGATLQYYIPKEAFNTFLELFIAVEKVQNINGVKNCFIIECSLDQLILDLLEESTIENTEDNECAA
ncbi:ATP-binding cassette sub-family A member 5 [Nephila pilipes]|uniref:ATP-binding cassette sub-family A member 5 n=1 Tax=Nephila pilipes TaxID=299642 RepID=A0A8X6PBB0_NEPPI|nr:ATP-binding cassette sub-family A member 5 [Nephila pilipes]